VPYSNGCGAAGEGWLAKTVRKYLSKVPSAFVKCCDAHDMCYGTCNTNIKFEHRKNCDLKFAACLRGAVHQMLGTPPALRSAAEATCITLGLDNVFHIAVSVLGCPAYKNAQKEACICK